MHIKEVSKISRVPSENEISVKKYLKNKIYYQIKDVIDRCTQLRTHNRSVLQKFKECPRSIKFNDMIMES